MHTRSVNYFSTYNRKMHNKEKRTKRTEHTPTKSPQPTQGHTIPTFIHIRFTSCPPHLHSHLCLFIPPSPSFDAHEFCQHNRPSWGLAFDLNKGPTWHPPFSLQMERDFETMIDIECTTAYVNFSGSPPSLY